MVILYIISILAVILVLFTGYILRVNANRPFFINEGIGSKIKLTSHELVEKLIKKNKLTNLAVTKLDASKTNYYSVKYNAIKLAPTTYHSYELSSLAISASCANEAKTSQKQTFLVLAKNFFDIICKVVATLFIPTALICAIIHTSNANIVYYYILLYSLIAYISSFIIEILILIFDLITVKKCNKDLKELEVFDDEEYKIVTSQIKAIYMLKFFEYTRFTFKFFTLASPDTIVYVRKQVAKSDDK